jgi:hypothetical protein
VPRSRSLLFSLLLRWGAASLASAAALIALPSQARAEDPNLRLLPVLAGSAEHATPIDEAKDPELARHARELGEVLAEAGYDLGFEVLPADKTNPARSYSDEELVTRAQHGFLVSPRIERAGASVRVRLVAVAPRSRVLLVRSDVMTPDLIEVRGVQMLRDLVQAAEGSSQSRAIEPRQGQPGIESLAPRSSGRAVLALNAAVLGGYVGFSLQRASGSDDERLIYPLAALGAGIGLGASLLVAEEWDIGVGDSWYLSAGIWWPTAGSLLLAKSYDVEDEDRYIYGLIGAGAGLASATAALALGGNMGEGGATIAHSGGAFGLGLGGLGELLVRGETDETPVRGFGYGAIAGVVAGGALATQVDLSTSRVLLVDLGASLGALGGAALGSPLLLVEEEANPTRTRLWLSAVGVGTVAGGALAYLVTRDMASETATLPFAPYAGVTPERGGGTRTELGAFGSW